MPKDQRKDRFSRQQPASCRFCRMRKLRCSRENPCSNCMCRGIECELELPAVAASTIPKSYETKLLDRLRQLEQRLENQESQRKEAVEQRHFTQAAEGQPSNSSTTS